MSNHKFAPLLAIGLKVLGIVGGIVCVVLGYRFFVRSTPSGGAASYSHAELEMMFRDVCVKDGLDVPHCNCLYRRIESYYGGDEKLMKVVTEMEHAGVTIRRLMFYIQENEMGCVRVSGVGNAN